jgi:hypothetical protein
LREENRIRVFEKRPLRKIFRPKRDKVTGDRKRVHNGELYEKVHNRELYEKVHNGELYGKSTKRGAL